MPWRTATVETERARFVLEAQLGEDLSFSELCRRHGISRPTGYKWLGRAEKEGLTALQDRSSRPHSCPHAMAPATEARILEIRKRRGWGARKIRRVLLREIDTVPSVDAIHRVLDRAGKVDHSKPRRRRTHPGRPLPMPDEPNATWTADFKGEFPHARRPSLLPAHRPGRLLPLPPRVPRHAAPRPSGHHPPLSGPLPRVRPARSHSDRQRPTPSPLPPSPGSRNSLSGG